MWSLLRDQLDGQLGPCVRLAPALCDVLTRVQRVYFLNEGLDLSRFVAALRGAAPYPAYHVQVRAFCPYLSYHVQASAFCPYPAYHVLASARL